MNDRPGGGDAITALLSEIERGSRDAEHALIELVYDELRAIARRQLGNEQHRRGLQTTALAHEAYLRLFGDESTSFTNRRHFFGAAAQAMRRILVDQARERLAKKRGEGVTHLELPRHLETPRTVEPTELLSIHAALGELERIDASMARVVGLRVFLGMTVAEIAKLDEHSERTVFRQWRSARAWLRAAMGAGE